MALPTALFPVLLIVQMYCAALVYALDRDWVKTLYWSCGATINLSVLFMK